MTSAQNSHRFGFIGAGKLAGSVIRGFLLKQVCAADEIIASEPHADARASLQRELGIGVVGENSEIASSADTIFLGVKPGVVLPVLRELGDALSGKLVISFAAGIRIADMEAATPARVMRVMTNTPAAIGQAATAFAKGSRATQPDRELIREPFNKIGVAVEVNDDQIDAVTALAGSGPAFVYCVIEALARGGENAGLNHDAALQLAAQMTLGAAQLALTSNKAPNELVNMVVTPGGTTAAGLRVMEERSTADALTAAVAAAAARGREMSQS
ncbi:MAG: pyrroline-5-carboxylate reductase [Verrucomicrobiota bacterium]|nr:pyrroline-5-carboxylate reductase [Verrucomicrobiota bacterium]